MGIKLHKPTSPGRRFQTSSEFEEITRQKPEKALLRSLRKTGGRNSNGRLTVRHRGGGHKRTYRLIDFKRNKDGIPASVASIEYDPNRSANIALLHYVDGEKRYIFPYQENADAIFNSALAYEVSALKPYVEPLLRQVSFGTPEYVEAKRLLAFLEWFLPVDSDLIPDNSILREFIGNSILRSFTLWQNHN